MMGQPIFEITLLRFFVDVDDIISVTLLIMKKKLRGIHPMFESLSNKIHRICLECVRFIDFEKIRTLLHAAKLEVK